MDALYYIFGTVLTLICLACICCTVCLLCSRVLCPDSAQGTCAVIWGVGCGEGLEQRVRSLIWLQSCGLLRCDLVLADGGLDEAGRAIATRLACRFPELTLCSGQELERYMKQT